MLDHFLRLIASTFFKFFIKIGIVAAARYLRVTAYFKKSILWTTCFFIIITTQHHTIGITQLPTDCGALARSNLNDTNLNENGIPVKIL